MNKEQEIVKQIEKEFGIKLEDNLFYNLTVKIYGDRQKISKAIEFGKRAVKVNPKNNLFWAFLGYAYNLTEEYSKSIDCFLKRIPLDPYDVYAWFELSFAYRSEGDLELSDWVNFNIELFMDYYVRMGFKKLTYENLMVVKERIEEDLSKI